MFDIEYVKTISIFIIGVFISCIFYFENILSTKENQSRSWFEITLLVLLNGLLGGFVMVSIYYGLEQYYPTMFLWVKIGIAGSIATMGKDAIKVVHKRVKNRIGEEK
jgi:hypothetical protein